MDFGPSRQRNFPQCDPLCPGIFSDDICRSYPLHHRGYLHGCHYAAFVGDECQLPSWFDQTLSRTVAEKRRKMKARYWFSFVLSLCLLTTLVQGEKSLPEAKKAGAIEIMEKSQQAFYYAGADMKADIRMELITADGKKRIRVLTMLRWNDPKSKDQKYFLYFREPADVRGMTFMVWEYPLKESDRWIYVPAIDLVRRIAARDARSSFVGSDFSYEDVSGRNIAADV